MKKQIVIGGLIALFLIGMFLATPIGQVISQLLSPSPQRIVRAYIMYNPTYFPYQVKVVYYPGNATDQRG